MGPQSAGADPGPVCYGRGGTEPTATDANAILGRINPTYLLGGEMEMHLEDAYRAVEEKIARPLGMDVRRAAEGIIEVMNANIGPRDSAGLRGKGPTIRGSSPWCPSAGPVRSTGWSWPRP